MNKNNIEDNKLIEYLEKQKNKKVKPFVNYKNFTYIHKGFLSPSRIKRLNKNKKGVPSHHVFTYNCNRKTTKWDKNNDLHNEMFKKEKCYVIVFTDGSKLGMTENYILNETSEELEHYEKMEEELRDNLTHIGWTNIELRELDILLQ